MSNKAPEVGDTVILEGVVTEINDSGQFKFKSECTYPTMFWVSSKRIKTVIPKPWTPVVGELARYCSAPNNGTVPATILAIVEGHAMLRFNDNSVGTVRVSSLSSPVPSAV